MYTISIMKVDVVLLISSIEVSSPLIVVQNTGMYETLGRLEFTETRNRVTVSTLVKPNPSRSELSSWESQNESQDIMTIRVAGAQT